MPDNPSGAEPDHSVSEQPSPYVVGIGASAGGIEALQEFFRAVTADSGAAYVVILHLSPDHDSQLAQVLQHAAPIPVTQVIERVRIEANHVYVVPPNKLLRIDVGSIVVVDVNRAEERRAPVDMFFRSLADAQGARAVAVVLSGTGPNGSAGIKRVKEYGGMIVVQDPATAKYTDMPRHSIETGLVDLVLPVGEIPGRIRDFHRRAAADRELPVAAAATGHGEALREILTVLRVRTGHDFSNYKPGTVQRRVARRIHLRHLPDIQAYAQLLREHPPEAATLMKDLLISVTNFFRDPVAFEGVRARVMPRIFANKGPQDQIRVWVPACATGEEAYSIAMLMAEQADASPDPPAMQLFATDLDEQAIAAARDAFYTYSEVADVSEDRLQRFFMREPGGYRVRRDLREMMLFAVHNVIRDPPFSHLDLISCRNLLIYLNRSVQERLSETFHFALRPGGLLFVAPSEAPESSHELFAVLDKPAHIYESRSVAGRLVPPTSDAIPVQAATLPRPADMRGTDRISPGELHQRLLERYAPPSLVITEDHFVVHMSQRVGRFLQLSGGEPSRDVIRLVRPELRADLRAALHQALLDRRNIEVKSVAVALDEGPRLVDVCVYPVLREEDPTRGYLLVTFDAHDTGGADLTARQPMGPPEPFTLQLQEEMNRLRLQLRATVEQYESQVEEAKAANEELQAMNEELRSSTEELETSKEELQSVNEELTTVNDELKIKIEELGLANNDLKNLINSSDIGTIFLDRRMCVKLFTPAAAQVFNLLRADVGRPLSDITTSLIYADLFKDVRRVLDELAPIDIEAPTVDGRWCQVRLRPYRTTDDRIDGAVITLQDISGRRTAEVRVRRGEERLRLLIDGALDYAIFTMSSDGIIDSWNSGAQRMFQYSSEEIIGQSADLLFTADDRAAGVPARELRQAREIGRASDERFYVRKDGTRFYCSGVTLRLGETLGLAKIARDLSSQQQAADALRLVEADFDHRVRQRTDALELQISERAAAHHHVTVLLQRIVTAQEDERSRIARDLHDQLGQQLTGLRLLLQRHQERLASGDGDQEDVGRALTLAEQVDRDLDFLAWELRPAPLTELGIGEALPAFVREWSEHYNIPLEYRVTNVAPGELARDAEVVFYRIAQEALNNVLKHAHATRVDVLLEARDGAVLLLIEDNGVGFDIAEKDSRYKGIGIIGMQERARLIGATLQIESQQGHGTAVYVRAALAAPAESQ